MLKLVYIYTEDSTVDKYILLYCIFFCMLKLETISDMLDLSDELFVVKEDCPKTRQEVSY